jgi:hypothetical protein
MVNAYDVGQLRELTERSKEIMKPLIELEYLENLGEEDLWQSYKQALEYCGNESQLGFSAEHKDVLLRLKFRSFDEKFKIIQKFTNGACIKTQ